MCVTVDSVLSSLSALEDKAFLAKQQELRIPSLQDDLEELAEATHLSRFKRYAADKHRFYPVRSNFSLTIPPPD
jgi:hypothetical protein